MKRLQYQKLSRRLVRNLKTYTYKVDKKGLLIMESIVHDEKLLEYMLWQRKYQSFTTHCARHGCVLVLNDQSK